jgi:hypothetical protein
MVMNGTKFSSRRLEPIRSMKSAAPASPSARCVAEPTEPSAPTFARVAKVHHALRLLHIRDDLRSAVQPMSELDKPHLWGGDGEPLLGLASLN